MWVRLFFNGFTMLAVISVRTKIKITSMTTAIPMIAILLLDS